MTKSWTIYVTLWTTKSDDVERKFRLCNTTNKRRRHGYESQTSSTGGGVRGRNVGRQLGMFEDTKIATWRSDEARRLPRDVRRTRGRRPKMIFFIRRSCEPYLYDQGRGRATVASEKNVVNYRACRHRTGKGSWCVVVWIGGAADWCILVELARWSGKFWYEFWPQAVYILDQTGNEAGRSWSAKSCRYIAN